MSSIHGPNLGSVSLRSTLERSDSMGQLESVDLSNRNPVAGQGGLAGRDISLGDGQKRTETKTFGDKALSFFKTMGKGLAALTLGPVALGLAIAGGAVALATKAICFIPKMIDKHILEPRSEKQFKLANKEMVEALATPRQGSVLGDERVVAKLLEHAKNTGQRVTESEIREMVATGENIAKALQGPGGDKIPLKVTIDGKEHTVESNTFTARAVGWYMMAQAGKQDVERGGGKTSDMVTSGSFVMKDPGNRMYNFLNSAPTAASRMSTHFAERVGHTEKHKIGGLIPSGKPSQRGIEDYQSKMPGQGGTMLFDKLKPGTDGKEELFVKFEGGGCPPYFQVEKNQGLGTGICRFFSALDRNVGHAMSFITSRFKDKSGDNQVIRQEHVHKGTLKELGKEFDGLVKKAISEGVIDASSKAVGKSVHKFGLPYIQDAVATIQEHARSQGNQRLLDECSNFIDSMNKATLDLGQVSDQHHIERRGAETHIAL